MKVKSNIHHHLSSDLVADGFQLLVDSGTSKHFIDLKLIGGVESRVLDYTGINAPMEIKAVDDNILYGTAQGSLMVLVRYTQDVCRKVKMTIVLVSGLKMFFFSCSGSSKRRQKYLY